MAIQGNLLVAPAQQYSETIGQGINNIAKMYLAGMEQRRRQEQMELDRQQQAIANKRAEAQLAMSLERLGIARAAEQRQQQAEALAAQHRAQASQYGAGLADMSDDQLSQLSAQAAASGNTDFLNALNTIQDNRRADASAEMESQGTWSQFSALSPDGTPTLYERNNRTGQVRPMGGDLRPMPRSQTNISLPAGAAPVYGDDGTITGIQYLPGSKEFTEKENMRSWAEFNSGLAQRVIDMPDDAVGAVGGWRRFASKAIGGPAAIVSWFGGEGNAKTAADRTWREVSRGFENDDSNNSFAKSLLSSIEDENIPAVELYSLSLGLALARANQKDGGRLLADNVKRSLSFADMTQFESAEQARNRARMIQETIEASGGISNLAQPDAQKSAEQRYNELLQQNPGMTQDQIFGIMQQEGY